MLGLGLVWTILIRIPLILNAEDHLDSDLAVDGLTLLDAVHGHWRWHYPGTPYMGILPDAASYPQALVWGANPITLVSGGTVIWVLVVVSTFWLAWRAFGPEVAGWAIVPLVFSSTGTIWLSGRITGGHLLTLAWHTVAFAGLYACLTRGGWKLRRRPGTLVRAGALPRRHVPVHARRDRARGDARLAPRSGGRGSGIVLAAAFLAGLIAGLLPREIGRRVDPTTPIRPSSRRPSNASAIAEHARLLVVECLPRLIGGSALNDFEGRVIDPESPLGDLLAPDGRRAAIDHLAEGWASLLIAIGFAVAIVRLAVDCRPASADPARQAVGLGACSLGRPDRGRVPGQSEYFQFGQLSILDLPADPLGAGLRARDARPGAGAGCAAAWRRAWSRGCWRRR